MKLKSSWLQNVNPKWEVVPGGGLFSERLSKSRVTDVHLTPSQQYGVIPQSEFMELTGRSVVLNLTGSENMKHVEKDDFIIHLRSFQGGIEHSKFVGKVSNAYCVLTPKSTVEPRFFRWVLKSYGFIQELSSTTDQLRDGQSIKFEQFRHISFPLPSLEVQRQIADYLDDQVSILDKAVELKKGLRTAYFEAYNSHRHELVTGRKLLPQIETDIEWLDSAPEVWRKKPLRSMVSYRKGKDPARLNLEYCANHPGDFPVYSGQTENEGLFAKIDTFDFNLPGWALLIRTVGTLNLVGTTSLISGKVNLSQNCALLLPKSDEIDMLYLHYVLPSLLEIKKAGIPSDMQASLRFADLSQFWLHWPDVEVQSQIAREISTLEKCVMSMNELIKRSIDSLEEYKTSLITQAITGNLDISSRNGAE